MYPPSPVDKHRTPIRLGSKVRLLSLSGDWLNKLSHAEKERVLSMVGDVFEVVEIDEYGHPVIQKSWREEQSGAYYQHSLALNPEEMEVAIDEL